MFGSQVKHFFNQRPSWKMTALVADDLIKGWRLANKQIDTRSGTTHLTRSTEASIAYIEGVFNDYKQYSGLDRFSGVIAEIGPGDNAGVAMLMRGDGCQQVDLIDRFYSHRDVEQQSKIYEHLAQKHQLYDLRNSKQWDEKSLSGIHWKVGEPAEVYFDECKTHQKQFYDFIVSRSVFEHLYNPLDALRDMVACLKPAGKIIHKIDFRDHRMFTPEHHELTFLEVPTSIYPLMVRNNGRPNRILVHRYREVLEDMKSQGLIDYSLFVTRLVHAGEIIPHKPFAEINREICTQAIEWVESRRHNFAQEFSTVDSQDLAVAGVFLVITKK